MKAPKGHKVVTVERQGGYAARCTVIVDGVETLCDATFGGFNTRTEARAAITHEEAPGAVGAAAGGEVTTEQGRDMTNPTPTLTYAQEDALIRAWARHYAASHAAAAAQLATETRVIALAYQAIDLDAAAREAVIRSGWEHPPVPRELWPAWAVDVDVYQGSGRDANITFTGTTHDDTACLERFYSVVVLEHHSVTDHGTWECEGTKVWGDVFDESLTPAKARALAAALMATADELERHA